MDRLPQDYEVLAAHLGELVLLVGVDGRIVARLGPSPGLLGLDDNDRDSRHVAERVHPDDLAAALRLMERARRDPELHETLVVRARHQSGTWRRLEVACLGRVNDPDVQAAVVRVRDITNTTDPTGDAGAERSRFISLAEAVPIGVVSADGLGLLLFANDAALAAFGVGFEQLRGRGWLDQVHEGDRDLVATTVAELRKTRLPAQVTFTAAHGDPPPVLQLTVVPLVEADRYVGWLGTLQDVSGRLAAERELAHRATHDALTGLPNRWLLADRLVHALRQLRGRHGGVAVAFIDIDGLKAHNDSHGHAAGDAVLVDVATRLRSRLSPSDTAARIGGDEFVVVSSTGDRHDADHFAEQLRRHLNYDMPYQGRWLSVSASVGIAFTDHAAIPPEDLLAAADASMYTARRPSAPPPLRRWESSL